MGNPVMSLSNSLFKFLLLSTLFILPSGASSKSVVNDNYEEINKKQRYLDSEKESYKKLVIVTWANDGGLWTDQVVEKFRHHIEFTGVKVNTVIITWSLGKPKNLLLETVKFLNPDIIYFPQEYLYLLLVRDIFPVAPKAHFIINSVEVFKEKLKYIPDNRQTIISSFHDFDFLMGRVKDLKKDTKPLEKVAILAPDYPEDLIKTIIKQSKQHCKKIDVFQTTSWADYVEKFREVERTHDAIFPLPPFEIFQNGKRISMHNYRSLINNAKTITVGYRKLGNVRRTVDLNIPPATFGKISAYVAFDLFEGRHVDDKFVATKSLIYNYEHIKSLNLKIPEDKNANFAAPEHRR